MEHLQGWGRSYGVGQLVPVGHSLGKEGVDEGGVLAMLLKDPVTPRSWVGGSDVRVGRDAYERVIDLEHHHKSLHSPSLF